MKFIKPILLATLVARRQQWTMKMRTQLEIVVR